MESEEKACGPCGPGYPTPRTAMTQGAREKILYVVCIQPDPKRPEVLSTVDVDPRGSTYGQIIHELRMPVAGDELQHSGWNICSSCHVSRKKRDTLVLPCLGSDRIYFVDFFEGGKPESKKTVEPEELHKLDLATPQTSRCSPTGEIIVSTIAKPNGDALGSFIAIDGDTSETKGVWKKDEAAFEPSLY